MLVQTEPAHDADGLIDHDLIASLRAAIGPAIERVIAGAVGAIEERIPRLRDLARDPVCDDIARLAHEIGGMAGQVGMCRLSRAALDLEHCARNGDADGARGAVGRVIDLAPPSLRAVCAG